MTNQLMFHCGGTEATLQEISAVPLPEKTNSYTPIGHAVLVDKVKDLAQEILEAEVLSESYGINRAGQQFFGIVTYDQGHTEHGLSISIRNSYDKSMSAGFCTGAKLFICDNSAFSGSSATYMRKHTGDANQVWADIEERIQDALGNSKKQYAEMARQLGEMKEIPLSIDAGYDLLGRALWRDDAMKSQQANAAARTWSAMAEKAKEEWEKPSHEEFLDLNVYRFYMALTEAMKLGSAGDTIKRHARIHSFVETLLPTAPVVLS